MSESLEQRAREAARAWVHLARPADGDHLQQFVEHLAAFARSECGRLPEEARSEVAALHADKDGAYAERNQVVAALSRLFPASLERTQEATEDVGGGWNWIVFIDLPSGQATWHLHDSHLPWFDHLDREAGRVWDGHSTEQKYLRLRALSPAPRTEEPCENSEGDIECPRCGRASSRTWWESCAPRTETREAGA